MRNTARGAGSRQSSGPNSRIGISIDFASSMDVMGARRAFVRNTEIYGDGEPADYVYKVVNGAVRTCKLRDDGRRQVGAFYLSGDVFGLEQRDEHNFSAEAISYSTVLVVKRSILSRLAKRDGDIVRRLWAFTSCELKHEQEHMLLLIKSAQERIACFLLEMAKRLATAEEVELPMSRQDIADYLGMTIETVSRTLTGLEKVAAIGMPTSRRVILRNRAALSRLSA